MKREQVKEIFKLIKNTYSQFEVTSEKIDVWAKLLKDQNPAVIMRNAERHVLESRFPPVIADLRERNIEAYNSNILEQIKEWEKNAARK
jgi:hypothetical protein